MSHQEPAIYDTSAQDTGAPSAGTAGRGGSAAGPGSTGGSGAFQVLAGWVAVSPLVKVTTKTNAIPPGDPVVVLGSQAKDGTTSASSISISTNGSGNSAGFGSSTGSGGSGGGAATLLGSG
jgi:hypothetical protein